MFAPRRVGTRGHRGVGLGLAAAIAALAFGIPGALATLPTECPVGSTRWASPVNGGWHDATKWSDGLPSGTKPACIDEPGSYVVTASTDVVAQSVFHGSPGAGAQPTLKVVRHDVEAVEDIVSYGRLELAHDGALGTSGRFLAGGRIAVAPGGTLATSANGGVLEAPAIEHAGTTAFAVGLTTRGDVFNMGDIGVPAGQTLRMEPRGAIAQTITFAGGNVNAVGSVQVIGNHIGSVDVTGGALAGDVDLFQLATLTFAGGSGGEYDLNTPSINTGTVSTVNGTIAPTQRLNLGGANTTAFTDGLVNQGTVRVFSSGGLGNNGVFLRPRPGATYTNRGTTMLDGGGVLSGTIVNEAGGTLAVTSGNLRSAALTNRGNLDVLAGGNLDIRAETDGASPAITLEAGDVSAVGGWTQLGGTVDVRGGTLSGDVDLFQLATLTFAGGSGGEYDLNTPSINTGTVSTVNGTIAPTQRLNLGGANTTAFTDGLVNQGTVRVFSSGGLGNNGVFLRPRPGATYTNRGTTMLDGGGVLSGTIVNEAGGTLAVTSGNLRSPVLTNRGDISVAAGGNLDIRADAGGAGPAITFESGEVSAVGGWTQLGGTMTVTGGTLSGDVDLNTLATLTLGGGSGGSYDMFPGGSLNGTIGPTQTVNVGTASTSIFTQGLVNRGQLTVRSTGGLGNTGVFLRTSPGATFTNHATTTLDGGTLVGTIVNEAGGTLAVAAGSGNLRSPVLTNRGTVSVPAGESLDVRAETGGAHPAVTLDGGTLSLGGTYSQLNGTFKTLDGNVTATGAVNFTTVSFSGVGTWARTLSLAVGGGMSPGASFGQISITGNYAPSTATFTTIELGATDHDRIAVSGTAQLAGTLQIVLPDGFRPAPCQAFEIMTYAARTGTFVNAAPIDLGGGLFLRQVYGPSALTLVAYTTSQAVNVQPTEVHVSEDGETDTYDVCLPSAPPAAGLTLTIAPDAQVTTDVPSLAFTTANWQLPRTVTVSAVDDDLAEATPHVGLIAHTASTGVSVATVVAQITDDGDDGQAPVVTATPSPAPNLAGWNNSDVDVTIFADDGEFGTGTVAIHYTLNGIPASVPGDTAVAQLTAEGVHELVYRAEDAAGNVAEPQTLVVRIDKTAPTLAFGASAPEPNAAGWNDTLPVTVPFVAADALSGVAELSHTSPLVFDAETPGATQTVTVTDAAGNSADFTSQTVRIDTTAPTLAFGATAPAPNAAGWNNTTPVTIPFTADDSLSGLAAVSHASPLGFDAETAGASQTVTVTDVAGNSADFTSQTVRIDLTAPTLAFGATDPAANAAGWNNTLPVTIPFVAEDALSGVADASPASPLSFDAETAGASRTVTVTDAAGNSAEFTSQTVRIDVTAPTLAYGAISPAPNGAGWHNAAPVSIPFATDDALSGVGDVSHASPLSFDAETAGATQTVTVTDVAGNEADFTSATVRIDLTAPTLAFGATSPAPNAAGWNNTVPVTIPFAAADALSGVASTSHASPLGFDAETAGASRTVTVTDAAGNSADFTSQTVRVDTTAPTLDFGAISPAPNAAGWNNTTPVTIPFTTGDALSGVAAVSHASPLGFGAETAGSSQAVTVTDVAGNSAEFASATVRIDTTPPVIAIRSPEARQYDLDEAVLADYECGDALSGIAGCAAPLADGDPVDTSTSGSFEFGVSATDAAGNSAQAAVVYSVGGGAALALCLVGEPKVARAGSTLPLKVQLCSPGGANLSSPAIVLTAVGVDDGPATSPGNSHPGELFEYDADLGGSGGYQYNLKTTGLTPGQHVLKVAVSGHPTVLELPFTVR